MTKKELSAFTLLIIFIMLMFTAGSLVGYMAANKPEYVERTDTVYINKVVRSVDELIAIDSLTLINDSLMMELSKSDIRIVERLVHDTIFNNDTIFKYVQIPISQKHYSMKDTADIWVSGYRANLDSCVLYVREFKTVEKIKTVEKKRFGIGVQVGVGATLHGNKPILKPYFGFGIQYRLF